MDGNELIGFCFIAAVIIGIGAVHTYRNLHNGEWHNHTHLFGRVTFMDGTRSGWFDHIMRRRRHDGWEYRQMTDQERADYSSDGVD